MSQKSRYSKYVCTVFACLILAVNFACGSKENFVGKYRAERGDLPEEGEVILELNGDGSGHRRIGNEEVSFDWKVKGDEIRFHTQSGGTLIGKMQGGFLEVKLPGSKVVYFKKIE